jgi:hypothetical protein
MALRLLGWIAILVGELTILAGIFVSRLEAPTCYLGCPFDYSVYALPIGLAGSAIAFLGVASTITNKRNAVLAFGLVSGIIVTIFFVPIVYDYPVQRVGCPIHGAPCFKFVQSLTLEYLQIGGMGLPDGRYCIAAIQHGVGWRGFGCIIGDG